MKKILIIATMIAFTTVLPSCAMLQRYSDWICERETRQIFSETSLVFQTQPCSWRLKELHDQLDRKITIKYFVVPACVSVGLLALALKSILTKS